MKQTIKYLYSYRRCITFFLLFFTSFINSQTINDYRSVNTGNWTTASNWEVFDGTNWIAATNYPGEVAGTNDVSIEGGHTIELSSNITNSFNSLTIGDGVGGTDILTITANSELETLNFIINDGGSASWPANDDLTLPAGASVVLIPSGSLDASGSSCNASQRLWIGDEVLATCNGNGRGALFSFEELNAGGGSLNVAPSGTSPTCAGSALNLMANTSGAGSDSATFLWTGSGSFNDNTLENPSVTGLPIGNYTFTVTASYSSGSSTLTNTGSVDITVESCKRTIITNRRITIRVKK